MDAFTVAMLARAAERLIDVLAGVLAVYCGYKLFALLPPTQADSNGRLELPGLKIVFARVGPGLLFAGLGAAIIAVSLSRPLHVPEEKKGGGVSYAVEDRIDRAALAEHLMELSCIAEVVASPAVQYPRPARPTIDASRAALLLANWRKEWGDAAVFRRWSGEPGDPGISQAVKELYFSRRERCRK